MQRQMRKNRNIIPEVLIKKLDNQDFLNHTEDVSENSNE